MFVSCSPRKIGSGAYLNIASGITPEKVYAVSVQGDDQTQNANMPDTIKLNYTEIEPECILPAGDLTTFNEVKVEQIGKIDGQQISIILYSDKDNNIHGVFKHKGNKYILNDIMYATDLDSLEIYRLQLVYNTKGKNIVLLAGIGSPYLGYMYLLYDGSKSDWFSFHNWGTPEVFDINQDGTNEVFLQFQGMHLNTPDLNIFSFQNGHLMITDINNNVYSNVQLDTTKSKIKSTYTKDSDNKVLVKISDLMSNEGSYLYHLEWDKQNPYLLQLKRNYCYSWRIMYFKVCSNRCI
jgi:hypothetical protein